jgi:oligopeptide/dipeptide ABC transporter ATP-binding protein
MLSPPTSCPFAPRCRFRREHCEEELPQLEELEPGHVAACFYPVDAGAWERSRLEASA